MAGEARPLHPLYPDLTAADWEAAEQKVALIVLGRVGQTLGDPRDIAASAVRRAYEPTAPVWDRKNKPLARYLGSFANSMIANALRKLELASTRPLRDSDLAIPANDDWSPEEAVSRAEAASIEARRLAELRQELADDRCCSILIDTYAEGERQPSKRAFAAGFTDRDVEAARLRIARAAARIVRAEARASGRRG
jgi:hypothetical protein